VPITLARAREALARVGGEPSLHGDGVLDLARDVVHDVSRLIAAGNLVVFGELGPVFSHAIDALAADPGPEALAALDATLKPGLSERGGQSLLRSASGTTSRRTPSRTRAGRRSGCCSRTARSASMGRSGCSP